MEGSVVCHGDAVEGFAAGGVTACHDMSRKRAIMYILSLVYPGINFDGWQFSTKPGWHVLSGSIDVTDTATRAGPHNGDAGRIDDPPHVSEVGEDVPERTT